jgi:hypothetical protein
VCLWSPLGQQKKSKQVTRCSTTYLDWDGCPVQAVVLVRLLPSFIRDHAAVGDETGRSHSDVAANVEDTVVWLLLVKARHDAVLNRKHYTVLPPQRNHRSV